jgi:hypothetical protein
MNQVPSRIVTEDRSKASAVSLSSSGNSSFLKVESLGDVVRFAELMCQSKAGIPSYLHGNAPDCMAITMQALQWGMNPFSVAQKSYKIKDVIAYEAQLIAAVINTRADLKRRPQISFEGEGDLRQCTVVFEFNDGAVQIYVSPPVSKITPKNSPLWKTDPDQQLSYYSIRAGGRRYCPEVILGVYDRDEVEEFRGPDAARDVTPRSPVMERLQANAANATQQPVSEREGFSASSVQQQTDRVLTGDIVDDEPHDPVTGELTEQPNTDDAPLTSPADDAASPPAASSQEPEGSIPQSSGSQSSAPSLFGKFQYEGDDLINLREFADKAIREARRTKPNDPAALQFLADMYPRYVKELASADAVQALDSMNRALELVLQGERNIDRIEAWMKTEFLTEAPNG